MDDAPLFQSIDNVGLLTHHHVTDAAAYERLGFTVCPLGRQHGPGAEGDRVAWGTGSRCVNFARNGYLELMGVIEPARPTGSYAADLAELGPGPAKITFGWELDGPLAPNHGITALGPLSFTRTLPVEGLLSTARIDLTVLDVGIAPLAVMAARHHDPVVVRHPSTTDHPNGAIGIEHVVVQHPEPVRIQRLLAPTGALDPLPAGGRLVVEEGPTCELTSIGIAVDSLGRVGELLEHNAVAHERSPDAVWVAPPHDGSVRLEFVADAAT